MLPNTGSSYHRESTEINSRSDHWQVLVESVQANVIKYTRTISETGQGKDRQSNLLLLCTCVVLCYNV